MPLNPSCAAPATPISSIQGSGLASPLVGQTVDVEAVVTNDLQAPGLLSGFYIQDPIGDGNAATSDGIFVFSSIPVSSGDRVRVRGNAAEFVSSGSSLTELSSVATVQVCSSGNALPPPVDVSLPVANVTDWERYEGMLVRINQQLVVTGNFNLGQFGQIDLAPSLLYQPTQTPGDNASWAAATDLIKRSILALDDSSSSSGVNLNGGGLAPYPAPGLSNANTLRAGALVNPNRQQSTHSAGRHSGRPFWILPHPTDCASHFFECVQSPTRYGGSRCLSGWALQDCQRQRAEFFHHLGKPRRGNPNRAG